MAEESFWVARDRGTCPGPGPGPGGTVRDLAPLHQSPGYCKDEEHTGACSRREGSCVAGRGLKQSRANNRVEEPQLLPARLHCAHFQQSGNTICALTVPVHGNIFFSYVDFVLK